MLPTRRQHGHTAALLVFAAVLAHAPARARQSDDSGPQ
jgi:hypothetical protein